jgi:retron-type reverse transcriptase
MRAQFDASFKTITSLESLLSAWQEFVRGKKQRRDVQEFGFRLIDNLALLHDDLTTRRYRHGGYDAFSIADPKPRSIHKASVRDRVIHHSIYRVLYPFFDRTFISHSFSCRNGKGTHRAIAEYRRLVRVVSRNNTRTCWVLKTDVRKFFASIDHDILVNILDGYIPDKEILWLLKQVIESFSSASPGIGLPLGNLTSQWSCRTIHAYSA